MATNRSLDALLDVHDVAKLLKVSPRAVYVLAEYGKIPHFKIGRRLRFSQGHVMEFLGQAARRASD